MSSTVADSGKFTVLEIAPTQRRLDGCRHANVAHGADGPLPHRAVEHRVVLKPETGSIHDVTVLRDVLDDRLSLLGLITQVLQCARHRLVDDLHRPAADQLLELHAAPGLARRQ